MYPARSRLILALSLLLFATVSFAERADHDQPINLEADSVIVDDARQSSTFTGNVHLSQGSLLITGEKIVVEQDKEGFMQVSAYGKPASFRQKREGMEGYVEGYGESIEYDSHAETILLHIQARLKRDLDEVTGEHITYSAKTEIFQVNGDEAVPENTTPRRVRAILQPKPREDAPPPRGIVPSSDLIKPSE